MSFDGFVAGAVACQLETALAGGKIEKIYQPEAEEIVLNIHANRTHFMLYISAASSHARIHLTEVKYENPQSPSGYCMLLRKHLQGGRIKEIVQKDSERIVEISIDTVNEMGYSVNKKLVVEIMGKHSNIVLLDMTTNKIIDSIKRISIDVNRYRQLLPGQVYVYPPDQGKTSFYDITAEEIDSALSNAADGTAKALMGKVQGLSPTLANEFSENPNHASVFPSIKEIRDRIKGGEVTPEVYVDKGGRPVDFHITSLSAMKDFYETLSFPHVSAACDYYYLHRESSNRIKQKSLDLQRAVSSNLDKLYLKKQRLSEDLKEAEKAVIYRLKGELLTAALHTVKDGEKNVSVLNYYDQTQMEIELNPRYTPSQNAQMFYKKYTKSKTALVEKKIQLTETDKDIIYLESVLSYIDSASAVEDIEDLRTELIDGGYMRKRKNNYKPSKKKSEPIKYVLNSGRRVLAGKNNNENDALTFKLASSKDLWFHTKDIPGSHVILFTEGQGVTDQDIYEAAAIAAHHSKGSTSENVPVDYTKVKNVKKPSGAKPGMVIFTDNKTVYVNPAVPMPVMDQRLT